MKDWEEVGWVPAFFHKHLLADDAKHLEQGLCEEEQIWKCWAQFGICWVLWATGYPGEESMNEHLHKMNVWWRFSRASPGVHPKLETPGHPQSGRFRTIWPDWTLNKRIQSYVTLTEFWFETWNLVGNFSSRFLTCSGVECTVRGFREWFLNWEWPLGKFKPLCSDRWSECQDTIERPNTVWFYVYQVPTVVSVTDRKRNRGYQGRGRGGVGRCLTGEVQFGKMRKVLEMDGGAICPTLSVYLKPLNRSFKNGWNGKFYVLPQFEKWRNKKTNSLVGRHHIDHISSVLINLVFFSLQFILRGYWDDKKRLLVIGDDDSDHDDAIVLLIHK